MTRCLFVLIVGLSTSIMAQDYPFLQRYDSLNEIDKSRYSKGVEAVFMGNSITEGWVQQRPEFFSENNFLGRGISGQTTDQMLLRFRTDVIDLNPKRVVILAGTNDIAENNGKVSLSTISGYVESMVELANSNGIEVFIISVLPAEIYPWRTHLKPNIQIPKLNTMLQNLAKKHKAKYVDVFAEMTNERMGLDENYAYDGVHPTSEGYVKMESILLPYLK
ncbi:MAG: hypothetical protein CMC18_02495 [Flavobacteriaceae bacterium]|nr:hypothetical protein [Flavobacteriaceae bacterium]